MTGYVPQAGDIVWIDFNPQAGHEQAGRRPALVLSPGNYNGKIGLMVCCPVTNQAKGYPFEVAIPNNPQVTGVVISDHVKNLDWQARHAKKIGQVDRRCLDQVKAKVKALLQI